MKTNDSFILRKIYGQYLLFPVRANEVGNDLIALNAVGADIWELAFDGLSEDDIVDNLARTYQLEADSIELESVKTFIDALCAQKLLYR